MAKSEMTSYTGFTGGSLNQVWRIERSSARRSEIGNFYKPAMVRFDDGELLAAPFLSTYPGDDTSTYEERLVFLSSTDDGLTWTEVGARLAGREPRMQILSDGTLMMTYMILEADLNMPKGRKSFVYGTTRSADRGRTWEPPLWLGPDSGGRESELLMGSRNLLEMPDRSLLFGVSNWDDAAWDTPSDGAAAPKFRNWFLRSTDAGRTWPEKIPLTVRYTEPADVPLFTEADLHLCPSGRVIAIPRFGARYPKKGTIPKEGCEQGDHLRIFSLADNGTTFVEEREFLDYASLHPHLMDLADGRLLCAYTHRNFPFGTQAVVSADEGGTWSDDNPFILAWFSWNSSCGFPSSVLMPDGSVLTAYTTRRHWGLEKTEDELYSEVVRWTVPA